jgi:hypothetical protein
MLTFGYFIFLKDAVKGKYNLNNQYILYDGYKAQNLFYIKILNDQGVKVAFKDWRNLNPMDITIAYQKNVKDYLRKNYEYDIVQTKGNVITYKIHGEK